MAPNGHSSHDPTPVNGKSEDVSSKPWFDKNGREEYKLWQKAHPLNHISYEKWKVSKYVDGISLYYATLRIFEESDSSDDEAEQTESKRRTRNVRGHASREPKKTTIPNGSSSSRLAGLATPSAAVNQADSDASGKKKRKPRKKPKSEEVIASDGESDEIETAATPIVTATTASAGRKSSARKQKKKPLSEELISPEDEEDDPISIDQSISHAIASPLPVRSAPDALTPDKGSEAPPKKTILKLITRRTPKKKFLSEETVRDDSDEDKNAGSAVAPASEIAADAEHDITAALESRLTEDIDADADSGSEANIRRGQRNRRPAQQNPYSYDALLYDCNESKEPQVADDPPQTPNDVSTIASTASLGTGFEGEKLGVLDDEALAILRGSGIEPDPNQPERGRRPKHFKGKGRAWKKEESDEDLEFNPSKRKGAKAKAKAKGPTGRKRGRPRKSAVSLSEDFVQDDSDSDTASRLADESVLSVSSPASSVKRARRPPRRSVLSEEIVHDDSDAENEYKNQLEDMTMKDASKPEVTALVLPMPRKRGRPRKSDQSASSNIIPDPIEDNEARIEGATTTNSENGTRALPQMHDEPVSPKENPNQATSVIEEVEETQTGRIEEPTVVSEDAEPTAMNGARVEVPKLFATVESDDEELCK